LVLSSGERRKYEAPFRLPPSTTTATTTAPNAEHAETAEDDNGELLLDGNDNVLP
jgi:hypothetical protein